MSLYSLIALSAFISFTVADSFNSTIEIDGYFLGVTYNCNSQPLDEVHLDYFYAKKGDEWTFEKVQNAPKGTYTIKNTNANCGYKYLSSSNTCQDDYLYIVPLDDGSGRQYFQLNQISKGHFTISLPTRSGCPTKNFVIGDNIYPRLTQKKPNLQN